MKTFLSVYEGLLSWVLELEKWKKQKLYRLGDSSGETGKIQLM